MHQVCALVSSPNGRYSAPLKVRAESKVGHSGQKPLLKTCKWLIKGRNVRDEIRTQEFLGSWPGSDYYSILLIKPLFLVSLPTQGFSTCPRERGEWEHWRKPHNIQKSLGTLMKGRKILRRGQKSQSSFGLRRMGLIWKWLVWSQTEKDKSLYIRPQLPSFTITIAEHQRGTASKHRRKSRPIPFLLHGVELYHLFHWWHEVLYSWS